MIEKDVIEGIKKILFEEDIEYIKTGFSDLDFIIKSVEKPALFTIAARPAMGKTAFLTTLLINFLKQKKRCLFFSFDLTSEQLVLRILSQLTDINCYCLKTDKALNKKNSHIISKTLSELSDFDVTIVDECVGIDSIKEYIKKINILFSKLFIPSPLLELSDMSILTFKYDTLGHAFLRVRF